MKVEDPGHVYFLRRLDGDGYEKLLFVKREGSGYPGNTGHHAGTNMQEVIRVLIDRLKYLDNQIGDSRNSVAIYSLREALCQLEIRAANRHKRILRFETLDGIETMPVCNVCGHIGCEGQCHHPPTR